jgi:hypothetical protein
MIRIRTSILPTYTQIQTIIGDNSEDILSDCEAHLAYADNNYYAFLWRFYRSHRATLLQIMRSLFLYTKKRRNYIHYFTDSLISYFHISTINRVFFPPQNL